MVNFAKRNFDSINSAKIDKKIEKPSPSIVPEKPKTLFQEKDKWKKGELIGKMINRSPNISGVSENKKMYLNERKKFIKEIFPGKTYISREQALSKLKELRGNQHKAKTFSEKQEHNRVRNALEDLTGLKGKY